MTNTTQNSPGLEDDPKLKDHKKHDEECHNLFAKLANDKKTDTKPLGFSIKWKAKTAEIKELEAEIIRLKKEIRKLQEQMGILLDHRVSSPPSRAGKPMTQNTLKIIMRRLGRGFGPALAEEIFKDIMIEGPKRRKLIAKLRPDLTKAQRAIPETNLKLAKAKRALEIIQDEIRKIRDEKDELQCDSTSTVNPNSWRWPFF